MSPTSICWLYGIIGALNEPVQLLELAPPVAAMLGAAAPTLIASEKYE